MKNLEVVEAAKEAVELMRRGKASQFAILHAVTDHAGDTNQDYGKVFRALKKLAKDNPFIRCRVKALMKEDQRQLAFSQR